MRKKAEAGLCCDSRNCLPTERSLGFARASSFASVSRINLSMSGRAAKQTRRRTSEVRFRLRPRAQKLSNIRCWPRKASMHATRGLQQIASPREGTSLPLDCPAAGKGCSRPTNHTASPRRNLFRAGGVAWAGAAIGATYVPVRGYYKKKKSPDLVFLLRGKAHGGSEAKRDSRSVWISLMSAPLVKYPFAPVRTTATTDSLCSALDRSSARREKTALLKAFLDYRTGEEQDLGVEKKWA